MEAEEMILSGASVPIANATSITRKRALLALPEHLVRRHGSE